MRLAPLLALVAMATTAAAEPLTAPAGQWHRILSLDVERAIGRSMRVDAASVSAGGLGMRFRQLTVLLRAEGSYPYRTAIYAKRSVDCTRGLQLTSRWTALSPGGTVLAARNYANPQVMQIQWDLQDGGVFKFVCRGRLSR